MHDSPTSADLQTLQIRDFFHGLRTAAANGSHLVLPPDQIAILLCEDIYPHLSRLEAQALRATCGAADPLPAPVIAAARPRSTSEQSPGPPISAEEDRSPPCVEELISDWLKFHVDGLAAPDRYRYSAAHLKSFFAEERRSGRLGARVNVSDLTPQLQARFRAFREAAGVGGHTISRDLAALRGALSWAWKHQRIARPPFIADVPFHLRGRPRDRILSFQEIAGIVDACVDRPDREHLIRFIVIELGTAGRPQAVLELNDTNIDLDRNLIDPGQPGRTYTRKRRAIVPIAKAVRPWVIGVSGKLIKYRVPISADQPGQGVTYFEQETKCIARSWNNACEEAGVSGATPKTLRHTMLTWLAERGVPSEQRRMFAGHAAQGTTARNYEHLSPAYLKRAIEEVDAFFVELRKHTSAIEKPRA